MYALYYTALPRGADVTGGQIPSVLSRRAGAKLIVLPKEGIEGDPRLPVATIHMPAGFRFRDPHLRVGRHDEFLVDFVNPHDPTPRKERPTTTFTLPADATTLTGHSKGPGDHPHPGTGHGNDGKDHGHGGNKHPHGKK